MHCQYLNINLLFKDIKVLGENDLIALGRDCFHRMYLSPTNLLTSEIRNQLAFDEFDEFFVHFLDCLFLRSYTEVALNSLENIRGN